MESQFHAYMESSETRRREQERQINALYREQTLKTQVLCMFEQMTGVSIDVSRQIPICTHGFNEAKLVSLNV